jgi:5-methylcytosine-specific restriction endonuclease McrA
MPNIKTIKAVFDKTDGRCWYCGKLFEDDHTIDHVLPRSRGGKEDIENLVPCCKPCNSAKRDKTIIEFRRMYQKQRGMVFNKLQEEWLIRNGIEIPEPEKIYFYYETLKVK